MPDRPLPEIELLPTSETARILGISPITVTRWAKVGKLRYMRTLGGHRRYFADEVYALRQTLSKGK